MRNTNLIPKTLLLPVALLMTACNSGGPTYITSNSVQQPHLDVSATGVSNIAPDQATVSAGVVQQGKTAREAMIGNATLMTTVFEELEAAGIPKNNITTSQLSLQPQYNYRNQSKPTVIGYEARNMVTVKSDDIDGVGPMLDALVRAGVNNINQVRFSVKDPKAARDQARENAIKDARAKAENMASAAGVKLGALLSINEGGGANFPQPVSLQAARVEFSESTPVSAGEQSIRVTVHLSYALEQ